MKKHHLILLVVDLALLIALAVAVVFAAGTVTVGGERYSKRTRELDLSGKSLSEAEYLQFHEALPDCAITWDVPFQGKTIPSTATELTVTSLSQENVEQLRYFPELKTVHAEQCGDYDAIAALRADRPDVDVRYTVTLDGTTYDQDTQSLTLGHLGAEEVELLRWLPELQQVQVSDCGDYAALLRLGRENPQWNLRYSVPLGGTGYPDDATAVDAEGAAYEEIVNALTALPQLKTLNVVNPVADGAELLELKEHYPDVSFGWEVEIEGRRFSYDVKELDISGILVESCEQAEQLADSLPYLEKLVMSDCGIDNETMAAFRERKRQDYKVVWTVYLSDKTKARTDDVYFMPIQQGEYYFLDGDSYNLRYCEDMICLDLGHHMIHNIDFVEFMPHLKYLILAHTGVRDVSPIVHCQELVYLEVDWSEIQDYTPIAQLKSLEDLNINRTGCSVEPLKQMTWLKTLWCPSRSNATKQELIEALPNTRIGVTDAVPQGEGWRNLQNYYDMRDLLGMRYMK